MGLKAQRLLKVCLCLETVVWMQTASWPWRLRPLYGPCHEYQMQNTVRCYFFVCMCRIDMRKRQRKQYNWTNSFLVNRCTYSLFFFCFLLCLNTHGNDVVQNNTLQEGINLFSLYGNCDVTSIVLVGRGIKLIVTSLLNSLFATCAFLLWINCTWY